MNCRCNWKDVDTPTNDLPHPLLSVNQKKSNTINDTGTKLQLCDRLKEYHKLSGILESVLDITLTVSKLMEYVGIHECKCKKAMDVIIYAFLHFDEFNDRPCQHSRKELRKDEILCDLRRDCCFTKQETKITYLIAKYAFQGFYFKQFVTRFDESFIDEEIWYKTAKKTIKAYRLLQCVTPCECSTFATNVNCEYKYYIQRRRDKVNKLKSDFECNCYRKKQSKTNWFDAICTEQKFKSKRDGHEFTVEDCTCICLGGPDDLSKSNSIASSMKSNKSKNPTADVGPGVGPGGSCMLLETCQEQLKCLQEKLEKLEKEKENWENERKLIEQSRKQETNNFSVYLNYYELGEILKIDLTGFGFSKQFITRLGDLKITSDTNDLPVQYKCQPI